MDIKEIYDFFEENLRKIGIFFVVGILIGGITFGILPKKYMSSGTLFVGKTIEESQDFYAYSGYYEQQTALSFTQTIRGFLEDKNLYAEVLADLGESITERNLKNIKRKIRVKEAGTQLIHLEIRANSPETTKVIWQSLLKITVNTIENINKKNNSKLFLEETNSEVWTREIIQNPAIFCLVGGLLTSGMGISYLAAKKYLAKEIS